MLKYGVTLTTAKIRLLRARAYVTFDKTDVDAKASTFDNFG